MKADPTAQVRLLDLQAADTELAQLAHRRAHLPELAALAASDEQIGQLRSDMLELQSQVDDVADDQRRLENEVDTVQARTKRDNERLTAGGLPAKDLEGLQHEIVSLARRQSALEDDLLEVMERREAAVADHEHTGANLTKAEEDLGEAQRRRDEALADLDVAAQRCTADREKLVTAFPDDLLSVYDRQRVQHGVGAALLQARRCGACRIELDRGEIARIAKAAPDDVIRCPECGAIMVRTKQSGL